MWADTRAVREIEAARGIERAVLSRVYNPLLSRSSMKHQRRMIADHRRVFPVHNLAHRSDIKWKPTVVNGVVLGKLMWSVMEN